MGSFRIVMGRYWIVKNRLGIFGIVLGHYDIFPNLFDILSGPLNFVKNRHDSL